VKRVVVLDSGDEAGPDGTWPPGVWLAGAAGALGRTRCRRTPHPRWFRIHWRTHESAYTGVI